MAVRDVIKIDPDLCTGCGSCITACAEGAIELKDGKARVISDKYCDGLGACLKECPAGALTIERREAQDFDEAAAKGRSTASSCQASISLEPSRASFERQSSQLSSWPIQMRLVSPKAPFLRGSRLLVAADCTGFACPNIQHDFIRGRVLLTGCPKLDEVKPFVDKLAEILQSNDIVDITVLHMEVPCCTGLVRLVNAAVKASGKDVPVSCVVVGKKGDVSMP
jgi:ferredoxin